MYERQGRIEWFSLILCTYILYLRTSSESLHAAEFRALENQQPPWLELFSTIGKNKTQNSINPFTWIILMRFPYRKNTWNSATFCFIGIHEFNWPIDSWIFLSAAVSFAVSHPIQRLSMVRFWIPQMLSCKPTNLYSNSPKYQLEANKMTASFPITPRSVETKNPSIPQPRNSRPTRGKALLLKVLQPNSVTAWHQKIPSTPSGRRFRCESCPMVSAYPSHVKGMVRLLRSMVTYSWGLVKYTGWWFRNSAKPLVWIIFAYFGGKVSRNFETI